MIKHFLKMQRAACPPGHLPVRPGRGRTPRGAAEALELFSKLFHKPKAAVRRRRKNPAPEPGMAPWQPPKEPPMNIAIIGSETECVRIINFFNTHTYNEIAPMIVGFCNPKGDPACLAEIRKAGIPLVEKYESFFEREDINLILDLTDDPQIFKEILARKKPSVRVMNFQTSRLFLDMYHIYDDNPDTERRFLRASSIYKIIMNDIINEDVLVIAPNHQILDANDAILNKVGLTRDEVIGRSCFEISHRYPAPCSEENCPCPLKETLTRLKPFTTTHIHLDKNNHQRHVSISCYPLKGPNGIMGAVEISKDITQDILMQKSLMQQEKLVSIGRLSAGVAHEINNPLTTVLTTAMLIQEDLDRGDPLYGELETIVKETMRCRNIVTALLDFARQKTPEVKRCSINVIVAETVMLTRKQSAFKDVKLEVFLDQKVPPLWLDPHQITQALINLLINAIESTDPGGHITVRTEYFSGSNKVGVQIQDSGSGIPPGLIDKVFEPFFTTKESGTGLGLAITHGIIVQHGGTIQVASEPKKGTTFAITLPASNGMP
jgi:nitrogen-specific signal transduction histidine kinase